MRGARASACACRVRRHRRLTSRCVGRVAEELADVLLNLGRGAEAGVGGDLLADPAPDVLVGVEVRAVGRQAHQTQAQVGRGQVVAEGSPPWAGALSQITISGSAWLARNWRRKAAEVSALLLPSSAIASTSPVSRQTAE